MHNFFFKIALNVLNLLGRGLYRDFSTIIGEAVSNAWDADADNVYIYYDKEGQTLVIKDDGHGMTEEDFQHKFLKVGYTKRISDNNYVTHSPKKKRPYIGRKGIGKLALLSVSEEISIASKTEFTEYTGGVINNKALDDEIAREDKYDRDGTYNLSSVDLKSLDQYIKNHKKGTIFFFKNFRTRLSSESQLRKILALYFRFSLIDRDFKIHVNDKIISYEDLKDLTSNTQFVWKTVKFQDRLLSEFTEIKKGGEITFVDDRIKGFIASVRKPRYLKALNLEERVGVDLFVNGRLREKNFLSKITSTRVVESYLYGQIHIDHIDSGNEDPFGTGREHIKKDIQDIDSFSEDFKKKVLPKILKEWDEWREEVGEDGDSENERMTGEHRKSIELFNAIQNVYKYKPTNEEYKDFLENLREESKFNFPSYSKCYILENLLREYVEKNKLTIKKEYKIEIDRLKKVEYKNKKDGNINIELRKNETDLGYLDMTALAKIADRAGDTNNLPIDSKEYRPIRNALMHTALLTEEAKNRLTSVFDNVNGRLKALLSKEEK